MITGIELRCDDLEKAAYMFIKLSVDKRNNGEVVGVFLTCNGTTVGVPVSELLTGLKVLGIIEGK